jgi:hypothetical protein
MALGWWVYGISGVIALKYLNVPMFRYQIRYPYQHLGIIQAAQRFRMQPNESSAIKACENLKRTFSKSFLLPSNVNPTQSNRYPTPRSAFRRFTTIIVMLGEYRFRGRLPPRNQQVQQPRNSFPRTASWSQGSLSWRSFPHREDCCLAGCPCPADGLALPGHVHAMAAATARAAPQDADPGCFAPRMTAACGACGAAGGGDNVRRGGAGGADGHDIQPRRILLGVGGYRDRGDVP